VKEKASFDALFWGAFLLTAFLARRGLTMWVSLFTAAIPVNYTSEFWEIFEATSYYTHSST